MAWFRPFSSFSSQYGMRDPYSDHLLREIMDHEPDGRIGLCGHTSMTNNRQLANNNRACMNHRFIINNSFPHTNTYPDISASMHNHGQHMNIYPDRSASLFNNNNPNINLSSDGFANGQMNRSINGTTTNMINSHFINNSGNGQHMNSSSRGQHSRNFPEETFRNWLSVMNLLNPISLSLNRSFDPFSILLEQLIIEDEEFEVPNDLTQYDFEVPTVGLSEGDIANIPVALAKDEKEKSCEICLSDVVKGEEIRILPCCHQFHRQCIDPWLRKNATCPNCRNKIEV